MLVNLKVDILTNQTKILCNNTNVTCETTTQDQNLVTALIAVIILSVAMFLGIISIFAALHKIWSRNWKTQFTLVQLLIAGLVVCGVLAPIQIVRISLMLKKYEFVDLCHFHQFLHLNAEGCIYLTTIILACDKLMRKFCDYNNRLTIKRIFITISWILVLPFVTCIIQASEKNPTSISVFSYDCTLHGRTRKHSHLVESVGCYVFTVIFFTTAIIYMVYIYKLWKQRMMERRRITQDPNFNFNHVDPFVTETSLNGACANIPVAPRSPTGTILPISAYEILEPPHPILKPKTIPDTPRLQVTSIMENANGQMIMENTHTAIDSFKMNDNVILEPCKQKLSQQINVKEAYTGNSINDVLEHLGPRDSLKSSTTGTTNTTGTTTTKDSSISEKIKKESMASAMTASTNMDSMFLGASGSSMKESISGQESIYDSVISGINAPSTISQMEPSNNIHIENTKKQVPSLTLDLKDITNFKNDMKTSKQNETSSEDKCGNQSSHSLNSDHDDNSLKLNPLRHTRVCAGNVWHPELAKLNNDIMTANKSSPYRISIKRKKKNNKRKKILKKQNSMDSIGNFSFTSVQSDIGPIGDHMLDTVSSQSYKYNARSIDSFLDDGLANILEQPEQEDNWKGSSSKQGNSIVVDSLDIPEMRMRSNTGNMQDRNHLMVDEHDEFRQRAQSDLTEDKQKRLLETKKFQSLRNRRLSNAGNLLSSQNSIFSLSTDSSFSDVYPEQDQAMKTKIKLITHNNLDSSIDSTDIDSADFDKCPVDLPDYVKISRHHGKESKSKHRQKKLVDSMTQTDEDIFNQDNTETDKMEYPLIRVIRPSDPGTTMQPLRYASSFKAINEDNDDTKTGEGFIRTLKQSGDLQERQNSELESKCLLDIVKCSLMIIMSFLVFYLPTYVTISLLDKFPTDMGLNLLMVARSIEYLYFCFAPKIYLYADGIL